MVKGAMRRIYVVRDPYKPRVPGYAWEMDMIVMSDRSIEGHKYLIVMKCRYTGYHVVLPLRAKSEATGAISEFIRSLRKNPDYNRYSYDMVRHIKTDMDGSWRACGNRREIGVFIDPFTQARFHSK